MSRCLDGKHTRIQGELLLSSCETVRLIPLTRAPSRLDIRTRLESAILLAVKLDLMRGNTRHRECTITATQLSPAAGRRLCSRLLCLAESRTRDSSFDFHHTFVGAPLYHRQRCAVSQLS
ncbi:unnamed protein product [Ectocarpus sp. 12 AP-2014]